MSTIFQNNAEQAGEILFKAHSVEAEAQDPQSTIAEIEQSLFGSTKVSRNLAEIRPIDTKSETLEEVKVA